MSVSDSTYLATFSDGASVLERVLLAIIDAQTPGETDCHRHERLDAAMVALIGPAKQIEHDLERALHFMARQRQQDICDVEMRALRSGSGVAAGEARAVPELANVAAREVLGCTSAADVQETARVLCEMFRRRRNVNRVEPDHVRDRLKSEAVQRILVELSECDILSIPRK
ncbi:hypothetical protein SAMN02982989_1984 [Xaviernesmea oryzae]|uniref:Uncharacterized protein n=1 Tax=Xaviernesmea oryzae TaxID=464029 RepID=A0A1X7EYD7_9HYPH|nr:hypothetical protein [Xaviernesmea oryzae]SMF42275.1 hypothetical protein SAMN02982989_1984 [Xaviernesmea oryzae]